MGFFDKIKQSLTRTKEQFVERFDEIVRGADEPEKRSRPVDVETFDALEEALISADVGVAAADQIVRAVKAKRTRGESLRTLVKDEIRRILHAADSTVTNGHRPHVIMIVGVNGTGKTTTVGKLARLLKDSGRTTMICAADTFRAAAVEQLEVWATRAGVDIIRAKAGSDPAAVVFDALVAGKARGRDVVLVDTAGRLHTRVNLMTELDKIRRVASREVEGAPHEVLLVLDATVGQNGLAQAREFTNVAGVTGIVLTKLDGTAKGGIAVAIAHDLKLPIRYVGVGETIDDLIPFSADECMGRVIRREVVADRDTFFMRKALRLAERGRATTSPNPMVGALVVDSDGVIVGRGAHEFAGGPHAEVHALAHAGEAAAGATLYCTLEPCSHTGRTGPCAPLVAGAGVRRVVVATEDPNPQVSGRGLALLRQRGLEVRSGVLEQDAARLNAPFFTAMRRHRPFVTMKVALSQDGKVAAAAGERTTLTGAAASRQVHRDRAEADAIAIGSGTMLCDDPLLTARGAYRARPLTRVIFDARLRTAPTARIFGTLDHGPVIIIGSPETPEAGSRREALVSAGAIVEWLPQADRLRTALQALAARGIQSLILEGGPTLHEAFWNASLVDRVQMYVTPRVLGDSGVTWRRTPEMANVSMLADRSVRLFGDDVLIEGYVHRPD